MQRKSREELIDIVQKLIDAELPEDEEDLLVEELKSSVLHPRVTDLIYHANSPLTAEEIVEQAMAYRPIQL